MNREKKRRMEERGRREEKGKDGVEREPGSSTSKQIRPHGSGFRLRIEGVMESPSVIKESHRGQGCGKSFLASRLRGAIL